MTKSHSGPATSPAGPSGRVRCEWCSLLDHTPTDCPYLAQRDPIAQALFLVELLSDLAQLRHAETVAYAEAYADQAGTEAARARARSAVADEHLAAELAAARVAGYQHILKGTSDD